MAEQHVTRSPELDPGSPSQSLLHLTVRSWIKDKTFLKHFKQEYFHFKCFVEGLKALGVADSNTGLIFSILHQL